MIQIIFESLSLIFSFFSFIAITDTPPWTNLHMEASAFLAVFFLYFSNYKNNNTIAIDVKFYFLATLSFLSIAFYILRSDRFHEALITGFLYICTAFLLLAVKISDNKLLIQKYFSVIVLAMLINVFFIFLQEIDALDAYPIRIASSHDRPYANFGQPNLSSTFILTGICCAFYLHEQKRIGYPTALAIAAIASIALAFSASRTAFLSIVIIFLFSVFKKNYRMSSLSGILGLGIILTTTVKNWTTGTGRALISQDPSNGRLKIWLEMFDAISQSPWLGYGLMNTRAADFAVRELHPGFTHAANGSSHNIYLDLLVWFGLPAGIVLSLIMTKIIFQHVKNSKNSALLYTAIPIALHSLLEYPLYFANFLFLFIFILSAVESNSKTKITSIPFVIAALALSTIVMLDYSKILKDYTTLRYYNNHFIGVDKPSTSSYYALDVTGGQLNKFIVDEISTEQELLHTQELTRHSPTIKNFMLILRYLKENKRISEYDHWKIKANAYSIRTEKN